MCFSGEYDNIITGASASKSQEDAETANNLLESSAAATQPEIPADTVPGVTWTSWAGRFTRTHTNSGLSPSNSSINSSCSLKRRPYTIPTTPIDSTTNNFIYFIFKLNKYAFVGRIFWLSKLSHYYAWQYPTGWPPCTTDAKIFRKFLTLKLRWGSGLKNFSSTKWFSLIAKSAFY